MGWQRLNDRLYGGPLVLARLYDADHPRDRSRRAPSFVECWALLDTGATHSIIDTRQVAERLDLRSLDTRFLAVAGQARASAPVHEIGIEFPDHPFDYRVVRVASMRLPGPFWMLIGMDLLEGSRLSLECGSDGQWLRWEPLHRRPR